MSKQVIKIASVQGGPFHQSGRQYEIVNFEVPGDGVYDATESYLNVYMSANASNDDNGPLRYLTGSTSFTEKPYLFNSAFIRNYSVDSQTKGHLDGCRFSNVLSQNLLSYTTSKAEKASLQYSSLYNETGPGLPYVFVNKTDGDPTDAADQYTVRNNIFRNYNINPVQEPEVVSVESPVMIPLSYMQSSLFKMEELPLDKLGGFNLQIETDLGAMPKFNIAATPSVACNNATVPDGDSATTLVIPDPTGVNKDKFFYKTQKVTVKFTISGTAQPDATGKTITKVDYDSSTNILTLTLDSPFYNNGTAAAVNLTNISVVHTLFADFSPTVTKMELVLTKIGDKSNVNKLEYTTWDIEMASGAGVGTFQKNYMIEPDVFNAIFMVPNNNSGGAVSKNINGAQVVSNAHNPSFYRLRLNNEDLTNRDVDNLSQSGGVKGKFQASLYYDRVITTLKNGGYDIKDLRENNDELLLCNSLPLTNDTKMLQLTYSASDVNDVYLYKQKLKVVSL